MEYCEIGDMMNSQSFKWHYDQESKLIIHTDTNKCLSLKKISNEGKEPKQKYFLLLEACDSYASNQKWEFIPMKHSVKYA